MIGRNPLAMAVDGFSWLVIGQPAAITPDEFAVRYWPPPTLARLRALVQDGFAARSETKSNITITHLNIIIFYIYFIHIDQFIFHLILNLTHETAIL